jgi:hypothetical protein
VQASKDLVDELVHQFTDPYACWRELIQNSIDAGSNRIEVTLAFKPNRDGGLITSTVQDWGEGMNRRIIEDYLITKFRSSKENDLTKIGKYGIGFVSVFALQPDAITVDTGRDGESWRVLFKKDKSYELLKVAEPFEGTRVTLHRQATVSAYEEHVEKTRAAVARWCRHSEVDVTFAAGLADGRPPGAAVTVHEPVRVDAPFQVEHHEPGLHVVVGPSRLLPAPSGFYNRGLTLLESTEPLIPEVAVKIVSRTLEHTLTRDNVKRDEHFQRAMNVARKLVAGPLLDALPLEMKKAAEAPNGSDDWRALYRFARTRLKKNALWLRAPGGGSVAGKSVGAQLVVSRLPTSTTQRLMASGGSVLELDSGEPLTEGLRRHFEAKSVVTADEAFTYAEPPLTEQPLGFAAALAELLNGAGCPVAGVALAEVRGAGAERQWIFIEALGRPVAKEPALRRLERRKKHPVLCFNTTHPVTKKASDLLHRAPKLSALLHARLLLVHHGLLDEKTDSYLTGWALT